jgi:hypothetical protein
MPAVKEREKLKKMNKKGRRSTIKKAQKSPTQLHQKSSNKDNMTPDKFLTRTSPY